MPREEPLVRHLFVFSTLAAPSSTALSTCRIFWVWKQQFESQINLFCRCQSLLSLLYNGARMIGCMRARSHLHARSGKGDSWLHETFFTSRGAERPRCYATTRVQSAAGGARKSCSFHPDILRASLGLISHQLFLIHCTQLAGSGTWVFGIGKSDFILEPFAKQWLIGKRSALREEMKNAVRAWAIAQKKRKCWDDEETLSTFMLI